MGNERPRDSTAVTPVARTNSRRGTTSYTSAPTVPREASTEHPQAGRSSSIRHAIGRETGLRHRSVTASTINAENATEASERDSGSSQVGATSSRQTTLGTQACQGSNTHHLVEGARMDAVDTGGGDVCIGSEVGTDGASPIPSLPGLSRPRQDAAAMASWFALGGHTDSVRVERANRVNERDSAHMQSSSDYPWTVPTTLPAVVGANGAADEGVSDSSDEVLSAIEGVNANTQEGSMVGEVRASR